MTNRSALTMRRLVVSGAVLAMTATSAFAARAAVDGRTFTTKAPAGWHLTRSAVETSRTYAMTSRGRADVVSIPPKGEVAVSVFEAPLDLVRLARNASPREVAEAVVGVPAKARRVRAGAPGTVKLGGINAVTMSFTYTYQGRRIRQQDTVTRRGTYAIVVETNSDTSQRTRAARARASVLQSWRWR